LIGVSWSLTAVLVSIFLTLCIFFI
jgi:hypothetical protein